MHLGNMLDQDAGNPWKKIAEAVSEAQHRLTVDEWLRICSIAAPCPDGKNTTRLFEDVYESNTRMIQQNENK